MERHSRGHQLPLAAVAAIVGVCLCIMVPLSVRSCKKTAAVTPATTAADSSGLDATYDGMLSRTTDLEVADLPLEQEAERRLIEYRQEKGCSLECAGYLDLFGNAWGCIVRGDGWVEILVIRDVTESSCSVQTIHLVTNT